MLYSLCLLLKRTMYLSDFNAKAISEAVPDPPTTQATMTSLGLLQEDRWSVGTSKRAFRCASSACCASVSAVLLSRSAVNSINLTQSLAVFSRLQFFDLFRNGGDFARRCVHESPQLKLDVAIGADEIRVDREPLFIWDDFCLLAGFRKIV